MNLLWFASKTLSFFVSRKAYWFYFLISPSVQYTVYSGVLMSQFLSFSMLSHILTVPSKIISVSEEQSAKTKHVNGKSHPFGWLFVVYDNYDLQNSYYFL